MCNRKTWRIDKYRTNVERKRQPCTCGAVYVFPHARGRGWCIHNEKLTHADWENWHEQTYGWKST
jgi:hypothetical protein